MPIKKLCHIIQINDRQTKLPMVGQYDVIFVGTIKSFFYVICIKAISRIAALFPTVEEPEIRDLYKK